MDEFKQNGTTDKSIERMNGFSVSQRLDNGRVVNSVPIITPMKKRYESHRTWGYRLMIQQDYQSVYDAVDRILNKTSKMKF